MTNEMINYKLGRVRNVHAEGKNQEFAVSTTFCHHFNYGMNRTTIL